MSKIEVNTVAPQCGTTLTLGESGDTVTLGSGASQTGFGRTGTVDWQTGSIKTSTFTAANGEGYFANTSGGAFTMNLPAGSAGAIVSVVDYTNTFQNNTLTIAPNGSEKIGGVAETVPLTTEGQSVTLVYVDATEGWKNVQDSTSNVIGTTFLTATGGTITTVCTNYKVHTFTGPGTFTVCSVGNTPTGNKVDYLVIGGGGSGVVGNGGGGGGGAGGYRESKCSGVSGCWTASPKVAPTSLTVTAAGFPITVGAGGAGKPAANGPNCANHVGNSGANSVFSTITSAGGGGGGGCTPSSRNGLVGGSGGGSAKFSSTGGAGNNPPVTPPQGNPGGSNSSPSGNVGGGGGGAGDQGETVTWAQNRGGNGGVGVTNTITGSPVGRAGGGGSNGETGCKIGGTGGFHSTGSTPSPEPGPSSPRTPGFGAGNGSNGDSNSDQSGPGAAGSGTANTGSGGGGTDAPAPSVTTGAGGSGIVVIRYKFQ